MASASVEVVRSILAANERGENGSTEWAHPDIEFVVADGPSPGRWTGLAGMTEGWLEMANAFEQLRSVADEYRELDDERVLVLVHRGGRGKTSGLELGGIGTERPLPQQAASQRADKARCRWRFRTRRPERTASARSAHAHLWSHGKIVLTP
jgi:hypothetical protein